MNSRDIIRVSLIAAMSLLLAQALYADDSPAAPLTLTAYWGNDGGYLKRNNPTDRYFTNGVGLTLSHQPRWAADLAPIMPFAESFGEAQTAAGYTIGQLIFTPEDISRRRLDRHDRPYAGYLYGGVYWQRANASTLDHFQINLGTVGPASLGEDAQKWVHEIVDDDEPRGWDNQLGNEITFQTYIRKKWKLQAEPMDVWGQSLQLELLPQVGVALGTVQRHLEAGATVRLGFRLPDDFGPGRLDDPGAATGREIVAGRRGFGGYVFAGVMGQAVEHNMFLEGNNFRDSHGVDINPLVGQLRGGIALAYQHDNCAVTASYTQTFQSRAFERQNGSHSFATWALSLSWSF